MIGQPGVESFRDVVIELRNRHIAAGLTPLMLMREEVVNDSSMKDRGGMDTVVQTHFIELLINCDKWRRRLTYNPDKAALGDKIAKAIDATKVIEDSTAPFGGDDIAMPAGGLYILPWDFTGNDPNIPMPSALNLPSTNSLLLLGAIDDAIVLWSRLNSKDRGVFITQKDSMRVYGQYQQILAYLQTFGGDENRVDIVQLRATDEPRGSANAPNRKTEGSVVVGSALVNPSAVATAGGVQTVAPVVTK